MKKLCALLLCMTMLLSLVQVAQADVTYPLVETFEDEAVGIIANNVTYRGESELFHDTQFYNNGGTLEIVEDGFSGKCFKATENDTARFNLGLVPIAPAENEPVYVNFKFKIIDDVNATAAFSVSLGYDSLVYIMQNGGRGVFWPNNDGSTGYPRMPYTVGKWYDFKVKFSYTTATTRRVDVEISDEDGNKTVGYRENVSEGSSYLFINSAGTPSNNSVAGASLALDEFYITKGGSAANLVSSDGGSAPVTKTVDVLEDFNFATPAPSNGNTSEPFSWYMRLNSPIVASGGLGTNTAAYYASYATVNMVDDCNGGYAPEITPADGKYGFVNVGAVDITSTDKAFISFKAKVSDATGHSMDIGFGNAAGGINAGGYELRIKTGMFETWQYWGRLYNTSMGAAALLPDVWYTIVAEFQEVDGVKQAKCHIYNDEGTRVALYNPAAGVSPVNAIEKAHLCITSKGTAPHYIDDLRVLQTPATTDSDAFIKTAIIGDKIYSTTPAITAEFDKAISASSTAKFVAGSTEIPAVVTLVNPITVEITPATPLNYSTSYTLDLSGIKTNEDIASTGTLSITTPVYSLGEMTLGALAIDGTTLTAPITFANSAYKELNTYLIAALYDANGNMTWVDMKYVKGAEMGLNTFTFEDLPAGADTANIKIFAWDNFMSIRPLYK